MKSQQQTAPVERDKYEPPAGVELGTLAALTQAVDCFIFPSRCN